MLALSLVALAAALPSASPIEVDRAVDRVLASDNYQTELPSERGIWGNSGGRAGGGNSVFGGSQPADPENLDPERRDGQDGDGGAEGDDSKNDSKGADPAGGGASGRNDRAQGGGGGKVRWRGSTERGPPRSDAAGRQGGATNAVNILLWILGGGLLLLVLVALGMMVGQYLRRGRQETNDDVKVVSIVEEPAAPVRVQVAAPELSLVEQLAARGEYSAATRELLRLAFDAASKQLHSRVPRDSTSRELLSGLPLEATQRHVLAHIVEAVEVGHFGQRVLTRETFERCRQSFEVFEAGFQRRNPA